MKKQIDLVRPSNRKPLTNKPIPVVPAKKETSAPVEEPSQVKPPVQPTNSFSFITILLLAIIFVMLGFIYYIFFLSS
jgi:hypothetical protein